MVINCSVREPWNKWQFWFFSQVWCPSGHPVNTVKVSKEVS